MNRIGDKPAAWRRALQTGDKRTREPGYPATRLRRPRQADWSRRLVQEESLSASDLLVCGEPTLGGPASCVTPLTDGQYILDVAPGEYYVTTYAKATPTLRGYYTQRSAGLPGNRPLVVDVLAGHELTGINPDDWS